jgi:hypothetical protein
LCVSNAPSICKTTIIASQFHQLWQLSVRLDTAKPSGFCHFRSICPTNETRSPGPSILLATRSFFPDLSWLAVETFAFFDVIGVLHTFWLLLCIILYVSRMVGKGPHVMWKVLCRRAGWLDILVQANQPIHVWYFSSLPPLPDPLCGVMGGEGFDGFTLSLSHYLVLGRV